MPALRRPPPATALQTLSGLLNLTYDEQANGNITLLGQNGLTIPLDSTFATQAATLSPASSVASGGVPAITLQSANPADQPVDVTSQLAGGQLGELIQLRDTTLPGYTASLDQFSANLANQFSAQGLRLFSDGTGSPTLTATAGLSSQIAVNPAVTATPSLVRDGTATGAASLNPSGLAGFTGVIDNVVNTVFSTSGAASPITQAQNFVSRQATDTAQASTDLTNATSYQSTLTSAFSAQSGVNVDAQLGLMIQLQNSYQANARVVQASESMFATLVAATLTTGA
jgi:flagellar hook-associated protein 1 FlgK